MGGEVYPQFYVTFSRTDSMFAVEMLCILVAPNLKMSELISLRIALRKYLKTVAKHSFVIYFLDALYDYYHSEISLSNEELIESKVKIDALCKALIESLNLRYTRDIEKFLESNKSQPYFRCLGEIYVFCLSVIDADDSEEDIPDTGSLMEGISALNDSWAPLLKLGLEFRGECLYESCGSDTVLSHIRERINSLSEDKDDSPEEAQRDAHLVVVYEAAFKAFRNWRKAAFVAEAMEHSLEGVDFLNFDGDLCDYLVWSVCSKLKVRGASSKCHFTLSDSEADFGLIGIPAKKGRMTVWAVGFNWSTETVSVSLQSNMTSWPPSECKYPFSGSMIENTNREVAFDVGNLVQVTQEIADFIRERV